MSVRVTFLGAGDAFNASGRGHAAYLVTAASACCLLDCGSTTLLALKREGFSVDRIDTVVVSHLHGDHFAGLPFLFLESTFETPRRRPLTIVGPPEMEARVHDLYRNVYRDLADRGLPFALDCVEVMPGERRTVGEIDVMPFGVPHQRNGVSLGFRVGMDGKTILYSGDTGWTEDLVAQSQGTDLFICECSFFETRVDYHLDYPRIEENHRRFGCRRLVLSHLGREVLARRDEIALELASDGLVVEI